MVNSIEVFDRQKIRSNRKIAAPEFHNFDFLFKWGEAQLLDRLSVIHRDFQNILMLGSRQTRGFSDLIQAKYPSSHIIFSDIAQDIFNEQKHKIICEEDMLPFAPASFDLILSNLNFQSINDLPGALLQIRKCLKPDGLLLVSMAGGETLHQLRVVLNEIEMELKNGMSPRVFPFADKQDMGALLQRAGYALPVIDSENVTVTYQTLFHLIKDLRGMGEKNTINARNKSYIGRSFFFKAAEKYKENFSEKDGRIPATFEILFLLGWAPHESQQKPLKPGSAKNRLSEALRTQETKL